MRDDTRDPNGFSRSYDQYNYEPTPGEWRELYDMARSCGASRDEAIEFADDETR